MPLRNNRKSRTGREFFAHAKRHNDVAKNAGRAMFMDKVLPDDELERRRKQQRKT